MKGLTPKKCKQILDRFENVSVMVIGDLILDEFIWGKVNRISPEAPVPVVNVSSCTMMPGGAANVSLNIHSLGAKVLSVGTIGSDAEGRKLKELLKARGMQTVGIVVDSTQPTSLKSRIIAHSQQVVRVDREGTRKVAAAARAKILKMVKTSVAKCDALIIEDYDKGVIDQEVVSEVVSIAQKHNKPVVVDPKKGHILNYSGVTLMTPNIEEARSAGGIERDGKVDIKELGAELLAKWGMQALLITLGEQGMALFEKEKGAHFHIPTVAREIFDVSGAGDTVIAALTTALVAGATFREAAIIANHAAGIVVGKLGTATTDIFEIYNSFNDEFAKK